MHLVTRWRRAKHNFNQLSMREVCQFQSGMATVSIYNFIEKLPIGLQIWVRFRCKVLYGFGVYIGPS